MLFLVALSQILLKAHLVTCKHRGLRARQGPCKIIGSMRFVLHLSLGPGMKIPGGRMG